MDFLNFLQESKIKENWINKTSVICFQGNNYPFLFLSNFFKYLDKNNILPAPYKYFPINSDDKLNLPACLQQSFLGQNNFYYLGEYKVGVTEKNKLDILDLLTKYKGPHFILFFLNDEKLTTKIKGMLKKVTLIPLQDKVDNSLAAEVLKFFEIDFNIQKLNLMKNILQNFSALDLDAFYMLIQYLELISGKMVDKLYEYLPSIITNEQPALYVLSQHFFEKNSEAFFKVWERIYKDYPDMFWISFWSEQIWKAYYVTKFLKQGILVEAKRMSFQLPFAFIKGGWKKYSLNELANQYQFLYNIDFKLKQGSTFCALEKFYLNNFA